MISTDQATTHPELIVGAAVLTVASLLIGRAWRRGRRTAAESNPEDRREAADRRGRRVEDLLTLAVASAAAYLSSTGLRKFGRDMMDLHPPLDWLPFVSLDMAAVVCGMRARRRAANGKGPGLSGVLVWVFVGVSATFSAAEAKSPGEALARAVWPIVAGVLFELGSLEKRLAARDAERQRLGQWLDRKLSAIRLLHPVEWVRVQLALAADETISQEEATRRVRIERAGYRLYRLRQLAQQLTAPPGKTLGRLDKMIAFLTLVPLRITRADRRAQVAQARVHSSDLRAVLEAVQRRVRTKDLATLPYRTADAAEKVLASLINTGTDSRTGTGTHTDTDTAPEGAPDRTDTANGSVPPGSGIGAPDTEPVSGGGTGTDSVDVKPTGTGTPSPEHCHTGQVGTGEPSVKSRAAQSSGTEGTPSDDELIKRLRRALRPDGRFGTGGKVATGKALGIGTGRAGRLMEQARELGPLPSLTSDTETGSGTHAEVEQPVAEVESKPDQAPAIDLDKAWPIAPRLARSAQTPDRELVGAATVNGTPTA